MSDSRCLSNNGWRKCPLHRPRWVRMRSITLGSVMHFGTSTPDTAESALQHIKASLLSGHYGLARTPKSVKGLHDFCNALQEQTASN